MSAGLLQFSAQSMSNDLTT